MRTTVLAGSGRAYELARLLGAIVHPTGVAAGWDLDGVPGVDVHVDPDGTVEVSTRAGTALLRGALGDPHHVAALVGPEAQARAVTAERYQPTASGRW